MGKRRRTWESRARHPSVPSAVTPLRDPSPADLPLPPRLPTALLSRAIAAARSRAAALPTALSELQQAFLVQQDCHSRVNIAQEQRSVTVINQYFLSP